MTANRLNVVLCWHMHQPYYREGLTGEYRLPWVYLHGIKDYSDMAAHLERHPGMRAVVNFVPVLLEQLDDYARQIDALLREGRPTQDPLLNFLAGVTPIPADGEARRQIILDCQRCYAPRMIHPYPAFVRLLRMVGATDEAGVGSQTMEWAIGYLSDAYFLDLITWYHLAWLGHSLKQTPLARRLIEQTRPHDASDRRELVALIRDTLANLIPRYRALADRGQIELSMTPYGHPIVPLLLDFANMRCAMPDASAPAVARYPGGEARARWHFSHGIAVFERYFGRRPAGVWLAEGGISEDTLPLLEEFGLRWTASGEGVWHNSCRLSQCPAHDVQDKRGLFAPWRLEGRAPRIFFRDDGLSDLIGFKYHSWDADAAVGDFVQHLENIAIALGPDAGRQVVSVILDGENAWEYYPDNGHHFLDGLYGALERNGNLRLTGFADAADALPVRTLPRLCAGSWVYGSFSTWIGSPDKNRGWEYLTEAKAAYDRVVDTLAPAVREQATQQLAVCEGSDWFWWFGDYNPAQSVSDFERLFRSQLRELYCILGVAPPPRLDVPLSHGGGDAENAGTMRRN